MKRPKTHIRESSQDVTGKQKEPETFNLDYVPPKRAVSMNLPTPGRQTPHLGTKSDLLLASPAQDVGKKEKKSSRISLTG